MGLNQLGKKIRRKREILKWTQEQLAAKARISPQYLSRIERGTQQPSLFTLKKIAKAFESELIIDIPLKQKTKQQQVIDELMSILKEKSASDIQVLLTMIEALESYGKNSD